MSTRHPSGASLEELDEGQYRRLLPPLRALEMNTLFARAVLEDGAPGRVLVDSKDSPSVIYVVHGYGMSLLFGATAPCPVDDRHLMHVMTMRRRSAEWLQVPSEHLGARLARLSASAVTSPSRGPLVEQHTRVNFRFSPEAYRSRRPSIADTSQRVARVGRAAFDMPGSVVPRAFWRDADQFLAAGAGFAVMVGDEPVALAFSSFVSSSQLELGIETLEPYRRRGLAALACVALIDHCLAHGLEPVWACRLENTGSHRLAEALGFVPIRHLPYFRLPPSVDD